MAELSHTHKTTYRKQLERTATGSYVWIGMIASHNKEF
jgi:hypothetical protein